VEETGEGRRSGMKGAIVTAKVSSCWILMLVKELWRDVEVKEYLGRGDHGRCAMGMGMSK
jgi:hypothetical protein